MFYSKEFIEKKSTEFTYWVSEKDKGVYHAMNKGLAKATGNFCLFLNSGDILYNETVLEEVSRKLEHAYDLAYGLIIWEKNKGLWNPKAGYKSFELVKESLIPHQGCFFNTRTLKQIGGYKEQFKVVSDWGAMLDIIVLGKKVVKLNIIISQCEEQGISAKNIRSNQQEHFIYMLKYHPLVWLFGQLYILKRVFKQKKQNQ